MPYTKENPGIDDLRDLNPKPFTPHDDPEKFPPAPYTYDVPRSGNLSKNVDDADVDLQPRDRLPQPEDDPYKPGGMDWDGDNYSPFLKNLKKWLSVPINFLIVLNMIILFIFLLSPE